MSQSNANILLRKTGLRWLLLALYLMVGTGQAALAQQDGFSPAATVNARVISQYELKQRVFFMMLLRQPGDIPQLALTSLIDDALRRDAADMADITVSPEQVKAGMAEFASRANLPLENFLKALGQGGVEPETLRDFVEAGLLWREVVRSKYAGSLKISEAAIDRAIASGAASGGELRLLLSEIIIPTGGSTDALALAERIKLTATTEPTFSIAARNYSKAPTAAAGGALNWITASALPPELAPRILALKPGEMTDPIVVQGAVQLYLLRDIGQADGEAKGAPEVDYATFFAPVGSDLGPVRAGLDSCDDLYDAAKGMPAEVVQRATVPEASLPADLRGALMTLDAGETAVLSAAGGGQRLVMLCSRNPASEFAPSREDIRDRLLNQKLGQMAGIYLEELRSNAFIQIK